MEAGNEELVSIVTPAYNTGNFIRETIESVIHQTYKNWEMIIVDDCSSDDTVQVIREIVKELNETRIRLIINKSNQGAALSRNYAIRCAKGRWIAFLDSDDVWFPEKLDHQIKFMKKNGYSFSYTNYCELFEQFEMKVRMISGPLRITKKDMYCYCWPGCLTVMYDTQKVGLIQIDDIKRNNDYAMWLKIVKSTDCWLCDETLAKRRRRKGSISDKGYFTLVRWHYELFRKCENRTIVSAVNRTAINIIFGIYKKIKYEKYNRSIGLQEKKF